MRIQRRSGASWLPVLAGVVLVVGCVALPEMKQAYSPVHTFRVDEGQLWSAAVRAGFEQVTKTGGRVQSVDGPGKALIFDSYCRSKLLRHQVLVRAATDGVSTLLVRLWQFGPMKIEMTAEYAELLLFSDSLYMKEIGLHLGESSVEGFGFEPMRFESAFLIGTNATDWVEPGPSAVVGTAVSAGSVEDLWSAMLLVAFQNNMVFRSDSINRKMELLSFSNPYGEPIRMEIALECRRAGFKECVATGVVKDRNWAFLKQRMDLWVPDGLNDCGFANFMTLARHQMGSKRTWERLWESCVR